jgi:hypothetical protein
MSWNALSKLRLLEMTPFVEEVALMRDLDVNGLMGFPISTESMLVFALTRALSVHLYAGGTLVLAVWILKSMDRGIDSSHSPVSAGDETEVNRVARSATHGGTEAVPQAIAERLLRPSAWRECRRETYRDAKG